MQSKKGQVKYMNREVGLENDNKIEQLQHMIDKANHIVFFGGAGTSTDSGLPDFRGANGLYKGANSPEEILSHGYYVKHTKDFFDFYRENMIFDGKAKPTEIHEKLVVLEKKHKLDAIITQNIDSLHQMAGSKNVIELHGTSATNTCRRCRAKYTAKWMLGTKNIPRCTQLVDGPGGQKVACGGIVKPDIVLYGEKLPVRALNKAYMAVKGADLMIVAGTSLVVYPAAGLISELSEDCKLVIINNDKTGADEAADLIIHENILSVFKQLEV